MKQCPSCQNTYTDDSLQFCLADGNSLVSISDAPTVQMSFEKNEPLRVNFPPDSAPTVFAQPPVTRGESEKKGGGKIAAAVIGILLILAIGATTAYFLMRQSNNGKNSQVATNMSPSPSNSPPSSPTATPNDETAKLKEEMANLKKQIEDQKKQQKPVSTVTPTVSGNDKIAYANSPGDGFLALRDEPDSELGERIAKIPHGAALIVHSCPKSSNVGKIAGRWCRVTYEGLTGWAFDGFMKF